MTLRSGAAEAVPYSLSRWTDVPAAKWEWFRERLQSGVLQAFDPRTGVPDWWSLHPEQTHSLVFWTKDPRNLVRDFDLIKSHPIKAHVTLTGWREEEHGAPHADVVALDATFLADHIGKKNVTWRFSPVPLLTPDVIFDRFERIARMMRTATENCFLSFLQFNDLMLETREALERTRIAATLTEIASQYGIRVWLCNDDKSTLRLSRWDTEKVTKGVCVPCEGDKKPASEACGCAIMVDPFTFNESCTMGCTYCYASDKSLSPKKANTTKGLPVIR